MRSAIVLAAGESRRMGTLKPLLPFGSGSVIGQVVRSLQASPIDAVLVVVGHRGTEIAAHLCNFGFRVPSGRLDFGLAGEVNDFENVMPLPDNPKSKIQNPNYVGPSLRVVPNPDYPRGMLSSVQAGIAVADPATTLFLLALADQPSIPPALIAQLLQVFDERRPGMLVPTFNGRRGHPLLIDARYRGEIAALNPEVGLRELLQRHPEELLLHPVDLEAVVRDMDTPEEYQAELARWNKESM